MTTIEFEEFLANITQEEFINWSLEQLLGYNNSIDYEDFIEWVDYDEYIEFKNYRLNYYLNDFLRTSINEYY